MKRGWAAVAAAGLLAAACSSGGAAGDAPPRAPGTAVAQRVNAPLDLYEHDRPGMLSPAVQGLPARVYVPDSESDDVIVLDQRTFKQIGRFKVGRKPQHVVPSWDLRTLWVNDNDSNDLVPIDPRTGTPGKPVQVDDPYNMYFTPDGRFAIIMAERLQRIDFRDAHTMRLRKHVSVPCTGPNHADFSASGDFFLTACEFSGDVLRLDTHRQKVTGVIKLADRAMPQDVKTSPDGKTFYIADMATNGVWTIDAATFRKTGFIPTGKGAHGLYVSRDSKTLYVTNRGEGTISLISFKTGRVVRRWRLPGGGSPDMGGVSADGKVLWLSGRYNSEVYAISTSDGRLIRRIRVGDGPHGLAVFPQPGRYSLGHTGVFR
ncbi:YncE family protein [Actinomadura violacea]|uniref:YncE family protein n=1 Tax=Actinomadura violacea TaxID=2819934 RepID=A0ABS3RNN3_9ACTN|nr:YncE family protein [Actinomadura violacea]MBO2458369.1 YncE family protein [Actinomadura violacea]